MCMKSCAAVRSSVLVCLFGLSMLAASPAPAAAQQDTTAQAADSVGQQDTVQAVPTDPAVQPDTAWAAPSDSAAAERPTPPEGRQAPPPNDTAAAGTAASDAPADTSRVPADSLARPDSTTQTAVDSVGLAADSAVVSGAAGADTSAAADAPVPTLNTLEESELQTIARVLVAIEELRQKYHARQGLPEDSLSRGLGLHARFRDEVARVVEAHGITIEFYSAVIHQARDRPELRKQLLEHVAAVRE